MPHEVDDRSKQVLLVLCGLPQESDLPAEVESAYWDYKRYYDRSFPGVTLSNDALVRIAMEYGDGKPTKEEYDPEISADQAFSEGWLKPGDSVRAKYRNKEYDAVFLFPKADGKSCVVQIGDDERHSKTSNITVEQQTA